MENWKDIPGYEGLYQVSDMGRVKRLARIYHRMHNDKIIDVPISEKILGGTKLSPKGYPRVNLNGIVQFVHRLVAEAFVSNLYNKLQVNHIDGVKTNNSASNLEWVTNQENRDHAVKTGLIATRANGRATYAKIPQSEVSNIMRLHKEGVFQRTIAKLYGVGQQAISDIIKVKI